MTGREAGSVPVLAGHGGPLCSADVRFVPFTADVFAAFEAVLAAPA